MPNSGAPFGIRAKYRPAADTTGPISESDATYCLPRRESYARCARRSRQPWAIFTSETLSYIFDIQIDFSWVVGGVWSIPNCTREHPNVHGIRD